MRSIELDNHNISSLSLSETSFHTYISFESHSLAIVSALDFDMSICPYGKLCLRVFLSNVPFLPIPYFLPLGFSRYLLRQGTTPNLFFSNLRNWREQLNNFIIYKLSMYKHYDLLTALICRPIKTKTPLWTLY